ncbi:hypothetical protein GCM10019016_041470 [Streptomyces prasinosporus]|uniref:Uncharacterized protein n=1 Tax=Streptomyces prasinosporus TaxID=68256 RepID=A0ABP6TP13_9ACTN
MRPREADHTYDFTEARRRARARARAAATRGSVAALRVACSGADLVHAHGLHASFRTVHGAQRAAAPRSS